MDIYHYKFEPMRKENSLYILSKAIESCIEIESLKINKYKYIVDEYISIISIFNNNEELRLIENNNEFLNEYTEYKLKLVGSFDSCKERIEEFEVYEKLSKLNRFITSDVIRIENRAIKYTDISYKETEQYVYWVEEVGHQYKGMKEDFYKYYKNDFYYVDKISFEKLLDYNDTNDFFYNPDYIKENFVDNYEEGRSILHISW